MKKVFVVFVLQFLAASCSADTFHFYKDEVHELMQDPKARQFKGNENDVNELGGCQYLIELGQWHKDSDKRWGESWDRRNVWKSGTIHHHKVFVLHDEKRASRNPYIGHRNLKMILEDETKNIVHVVYIGPWYYSPTLNKPIRFFAYQDKDYKNPPGLNYHGTIHYQYESQTEENKNIPEKPFSLMKDGVPDRFGLCVVKWTAKYGYNAIAETKKVYPKGISGFFARIFQDYDLVPTGKIIEAKE